MKPRRTRVAPFASVFGSDPSPEEVPTKIMTPCLAFTLVVVHDCRLRVDGISKYLNNQQFAFDHAFSKRGHG